MRANTISDMISTNGTSSLSILLCWLCASIPCLSLFQIIHSLASWTTVCLFVCLSLVSFFLYRSGGSSGGGFACGCDCIFVVVVCCCFDFSQRYQHVLALRAILTGIILKGLTLRKFVSDVCVCMFHVCEVIGFVDWLDRGLIQMWEEFRNVYLLMTWVWLSWCDPVWLTGH